MSELRESPGPYKDVSPDGWPGLLAALVVVFGVVVLFVDEPVANVLGGVVIVIVLVSLGWYLRAYFRSRRSSRDWRSNLRAIMDIGGAGWLGILAILFLPVVLLTMHIGGATETIVSWIFAFLGALALGAYLVSVLRSRH